MPEQILCVRCGAPVTGIPTAEVPLPRLVHDTPDQCIQALQSELETAQRQVRAAIGTTMEGADTVVTLLQDRTALQADLAAERKQREEEQYVFGNAMEVLEYLHEHKCIRGMSSVFTRDLTEQLQAWREWKQKQEAGLVPVQEG